MRMRHAARLFATGWLPHSSTEPSVDRHARRVISQSLMVCPSAVPQHLSVTTESAVRALGFETACTKWDTPLETLFNWFYNSAESAELKTYFRSELGVPRCWRDLT